MAAKTIGNLITEARQILQDQVTPYRYPDTDLYLILNTCFGEVRRIRPDLFFSLNYVLPSFTTADIAMAFPLNEMWYAPIVYYIVGVSETRDDEFTVDGRAATLLNQFVAKLRTAT